MATHIKQQGRKYLIFYVTFATLGFILIMYYLSYTLVHFTTSQQFPINSFSRFPLTYLIFPAEVFSFLFSLYFAYNLIQGNSAPTHPSPPIAQSQDGPIDNKRVAILIPVYNEPRDIVMRTLDACRKLRWKGGIHLYLLDDSTTPEDRANMAQLCRKFHATLVRRKDRVGYKAGNLNNAVNHHLTEQFFAVFDSDQAPEIEFLEETMGSFNDPHVGFAQTPQHYVDNSTPIERAQELGANIFYQAQCVSKAKDGAMPFCGTNLVVRTSAFRSVNGFSYYTATEDIEIGLRMNEIGYHGSFIPKVLVHGYAPTNFHAYASQQYRWANGNLAILRKNWTKIILGNLSFRQQIHTFFTLGWWLMGIVGMVYVAIPILSLFFGGTHHTWLPTSILLILFLNVAMGIGMIYAALSNRVDGEKVTLKDAFLQYSLITNSMFIYARAAMNAAVGKFIVFVRTDKNRQKTGLGQIKWNLILSAICFGFSIFALFRSVTAGDIEGVRSFLPISLWLMFYSTILASSVLFVGEYPHSTRSKNHSQNDAEQLSADIFSDTISPTQHAQDLHARAQFRGNS